MADSTLNQFVARGTNAERVAFTPVPPTPASGNDPGYFFYETDTGNTYSWDGAAWDQVNTPASFASTTEVLTGTNTTKVVNPDAMAALWEQGSDVASAGTISLGEGGYFNITGTTTITDIDFATDKAGRKAWVKFAGILTLTHNASTLILPTGANITTAAGDTACFVSEGTDAVRCVAYQRADGSALTGGAGGNFIFVGSQAVSGSAATTLTLSGLDLNTDQRWFIRCSFHNATTSTSTISLYYNADTTATNYNRQILGLSNVTYTNSRQNDAVIGGLDANNAGTGAGDTEFEGYITVSRSGFVTAYIYSVRTGNSTIQLQWIGHQWRTASTNVTSIVISASVASSLDVGGTIELWKVTT